MNIHRTESYHMSIFRHIFAFVSVYERLLCFVEGCTIFNLTGCSPCFDLNSLMTYADLDVLSPLEGRETPFKIQMQIAEVRNVSCLCSCSGSYFVV